MKKYKFSQQFINDNVKYIYENMYEKKFDYEDFNKTLPKVSYWLDECLFNDHYKYTDNAPFDTRIYNLTVYLGQAVRSRKKIDAIWLSYFGSKTENELRKLVDKGLINEQKLKILSDQELLKQWIKRFDNIGVPDLIKERITTGKSRLFKNVGD